MAAKLVDVLVAQKKISLVGDKILNITQEKKNLLKMINLKHEMDVAVNV